MQKKSRILNILLLATVWMIAQTVYAQSSANADEKNLLVYYNKGFLDVFPESVLAGEPKYGRDQLRVETVNDTAFCYDEIHIDSVVIRKNSELSGRLASITQFKINNKYNDQVYTDVLADIVEDSVITADIGAIGRWLRPSVQLSDEQALLYIGTERQVNKQSRHSFAKDVYYTVAMPNQRVYKQVLVKEAVWSGDEEEFIASEIALDASMFSSNLPGKDDEGFDKMLDGNIYTIFHSTWDVAQEDKEYIYSTHPYLDVALNESLRFFSFSYTTRDHGSYWPIRMTLYVSNDGENWNEIRQFSSADGLPESAGAVYQSTMIDLGGEYRYLRFYLNEAAHRLYLVFAEFSMQRYTENPNYQGGEPLEPAEYSYTMMPFGRQYRTHINWLTDEADQVPRVDIYTENGMMISSKEYYLNAEITIDGAGVFPSMETTPVQIKGRGNSSWSSWYWDKNPYRLKFEEKQKPFGLTKGKSWVLLANKQSGSMTSNAIGMKAACLVGTAGANHIVPVELYINGEYRGSYNFTEKVGLANNSIDLEDESRAALLELDTYYDEDYRFYSSPYNLPVNIKEPNFAEEETQITMDAVEREFNGFLSNLKNGRNVREILDVNMLARYLMVNELIVNFELMHPKSTYLYNESIGSSGSKFVFGPVWDLDWAFGYENSRSYYSNDAQTNYWTAMQFRMEKPEFIYDLRYVISDFDQVYYAVWNRFVKHQLDELLDFCDDYYAYANPSFEHNAYMWGDGNNYSFLTTRAKNWLKSRTNYVFNSLNSYSASDDEKPIVDDFGYEGDADGIDIHEYKDNTDGDALVDVYDLNGRLVKRQANVLELRQGLKPGIYVIRGKKMVVK